MYSTITNGTYTLKEWCLLNKTKIFLALIIAAGFFLRLYFLSNDSLWIDEGYTVMQQRAISQHGYPLLMSDYKEIKDLLLPYLLAGAELFAGEDVFLFRLISVIFGSFSIFLIFLIGRNLGNRYIGLAASFLMAFSYWHIAWSRQIRAYSLLVFFILFSLYFLIEYEKNGKKKSLYWAFFFATVAILAKSSFGMLLLPAFGTYLLLKRSYVLLTFCLGGCLFLALFFQKTILDAFSMSLVNYLPYYALGYLWQYFGIIFVVALVGYYFAVFEKKKYLHLHFFNAVYFLFPLLFFSFFSYVNQRRYLFFVTPLLFLYAGYFIYYFSKGFARKGVLAAFAIVFLAVVASDFFSVKSLQFFPMKSYPLEEYTPQPNFKLAYEMLEKELKQDDVILSAYPYMDFIYLNRFDYALDVSYTGRPDDSSLHNSREFYTGAPGIMSLENLTAVRSGADIYVVLDNMAKLRMNQELLVHIKNNAKLLWEDDRVGGQEIWVYKLEKQTR